MPYNVTERLIFRLQGPRLRSIKLLPAKPFGIYGELAYVLLRGQSKINICVYIVIIYRFLAFVLI